MDVHLSQEAQQYLAALQLVSPRACGFLMGHKRGHRFFVEKILPSSTGFMFSLKKQLQLHKILDDPIIGFFSFDTDKTLLKKMLVPFSTGMLFLKINHSEENKTSFNPFVIEYDNKFYLSPIKIKSLA